METQVDIHIDGVHFTYPTTSENVLAELSFSIDKGTFAGITGPNGCGKTTLLKCMTKLLEPDAGVITIMGDPLENLKPRELAQNVGVVPQRWDLAFPFTAAEVVAMGRYPHKRRFERETDQDREIIRQAMALTSTLHLASRPVTQMSGGELQRIVIAQALAQSPRILLLDEPTSNLDINHQVEIFDMIKQLNRVEKLTVISILHDLNLAAQYCDTLIMLKEGRVFAAGDPAQVLTRTNIEQVYGARVRVRMDPVTRRPYIGLCPGVCSEKQHLNVHVIGGGGMAASLLELLTGRGYTISCGVINVWDGDWEVATDLGIPVVTEKPFSPVGPAAHERNLAVLEESDCVIVGGIPFGNGNIRNLEAAEHALELNIPVILCDFPPIDDRDFTNGRAKAIWNRLISCGAVTVDRVDRIWPLLQRMEKGTSSGSKVEQESAYLPSVL